MNCTLTSVFRQSGVITPEVCSLLMNAYDLCAPYSSFHDQHGNPLIQWSDQHMNPAATIAFISAVKRCYRLTEQAFQCQRIYPETAILAVLGEGQGHEAHADNEKLIGGMWVPNHTPNRHFAGILYLNSNLGGGELYFTDRSGLIQPNEGLYVSFPCNRNFVHEVKSVSYGRRFSVALWFTTKRHYANFPLLYTIDEFQDSVNAL